MKSPMDEQQMLYSIARWIASCVAIVLVSMIGSCAANNSYQDYLRAEQYVAAIKTGADPMRVSCSLRWLSWDAQTCLMLATQKGD